MGEAHPSLNAEAQRLMALIETAAAAQTEANCEVTKGSSRTEAARERERAIMTRVDREMAAFRAGTAPPLASAAGGAKRTSFQHQN